MSNVFNKYGVQLDKCGVLLTATSFTSIDKANSTFLSLSCHPKYSDNGDYEVTLYETRGEGEEARIIRRHRGGAV